MSPTLARLLSSAIRLKALLPMVPSQGEAVTEVDDNGLVDTPTETDLGYEIG